jgi:hypothetical protein
MYTRKYEEVIDFLENLDETSFLIAEQAIPIQKLYIQPLVREVDGKNVAFLALRNIQIKKQDRRKGIMTYVFNSMKDSGLNIMFDDIINDHLFNFLIEKGFTAFYYEKQDCKIRSAYLIQNME